MKASRIRGPKSNAWCPSGRRGDTGSWETPPAELGGRLQRMHLQELWFGASGPLNCERIGFCWLQPPVCGTQLCGPRKLTQGTGRPRGGPRSIQTLGWREGVGLGVCSEAGTHRWGDSGFLHTQRGDRGALWDRQLGLGWMESPTVPWGGEMLTRSPRWVQKVPGAVGQLFLPAGPLTAPATCLYPDSPRGRPGRAARAPPWGDRAQLWELPARCGQNWEVCSSSEKPELRSLSSPGLREGAAGGLGHGVPPLKVLPPPQRGPAGSLGLDTSMPPAGHTCQAPSIAFCLEAITHVFLSLVYRCCRERFIAVVLIRLHPPS